MPEPKPENDLIVGARVRLWIGPPKRGGYRYGVVTGIDNLGTPGVQIQFDRPVNFAESCYATHDEVERVTPPAHPYLDDNGGGACQDCGKPFEDHITSPAQRAGDGFGGAVDRGY